MYVLLKWRFYSMVIIDIVVNKYLIELIYKLALLSLIFALKSINIQLI